MKENKGWDIALKLFENFPFRFLISVVVGAIVYFVTPNNSKLLEKFSICWYIVVVSLITFLIISFIIWMIEIIKNKKELVNNREKAFNDLKEDLYNITDQLNDKELEIIKTIVANGNEPYLAKGVETHCFNSNFFKIGFPKCKQLNRKIKNGYIEEFEIAFWLDHKLYRLAKLVYERNGKLSRFDKGEK